MKYLSLLLPVLLLIACGLNSSGHNPTTAGNSGLKDTTVHIIWRGMEMDTSLSKTDSFSVVMVNDAYCKNATDPIKAAIAYVSTFIGSDCQWDGEPNDKMTNLNCKIIKALGLGYQCSDKHLGFLRQWLRNEPKLLKRLDDCPVVPFTASSQETFDKMNLQIKKDTLIISFAASGVNMRMQKSWTWKGKYIFRINDDELHLVAEKESAPKYSGFHG